MLLPFEITPTIIGLFVIDVIAGIIIRRSNIGRMIESIIVICTILPLGVFLMDWNLGVQSGKYGISDLNDAVITVLGLGFAAAFSGGIIGMVAGGFRNN